MNTYTAYEHDGLTIYVNDETKKVHHAVNYNSNNIVTLYPYEPAKEGGLDNAADFYTLRQVMNRMKTGKIVFK